MEDLIPVHETSRKQRLFDVSLVLASQGVDHWIHYENERYVVVVPPELEREAREHIESWIRENRPEPKRPAELDLTVRLQAVLFMAIPIVTYFLLNLGSGNYWYRHYGSAKAARILEGEWWRTITALTLHADHAHFLSNLVAGYILTNLLNHFLSVGSIVLLATLAAGLGNLLTALTSAPTHNSVGFSTAVFAVLGLLAGHHTRNRHVLGEKGIQGFAPLFAGFFMAVLIGTGENVDIKAHFFGFMMGALTGFVTYSIREVLNRMWVQVVLGLVGMGLYPLAWWLALR